MTTDLVIVTEASDKYFKYSITSTCSFLENNKWFRGQLYFLINSKNPLSNTNKAILLSIYPKVAFINTETSRIFKLVEAKFHKLHIYPMASIQDLSKIAALDSLKENIFYFSNFCLFLNDVSSIFKTEGDFIFSETAELFYLKRYYIDIPSLEDSIESVNSLGLGQTHLFICNMLKSESQCNRISQKLFSSKEFLDNKFIQLQHKLKTANCIYFNDLLSQETTRNKSIVLSPNRSTSKINRVFLSKSNEYTTKSTQIRSNFIYNYIETSSYLASPESGEVTNITKNAEKLRRTPTENSNKIKSRPTKQILIDDIPDNSLSFDLDNSVYLKNKNKKIKLAIITGIWQRPEIFKYFAAGVKELEKLEDFDITTIISGSEGETSRKLVEDHGFTYIEIPNRPLAVKMNAPLKIAKELGVDYVLCMGSDDILHPNVLVEYLKYMRSDIDYIGVTDFYFYDTTTAKSAYWGGYREPYRLGHTCGAGRVLSAKLLDQWDWTIWSSKQDDMLDSSMQIKLSSTVHTSIYFSLKSKGLYGLDIKSSVNMTPFTLWDNTEFIDTDEIKNKFSYLALK